MLIIRRETIVTEILIEQWTLISTIVCHFENNNFRLHARKG